MENSVRVDLSELVQDLNETTGTPVKLDSENGVETSKYDDTTSTHLSAETWWKPHKRDTIPLLLAIISFIVCFVAALVAYLLLDQKGRGIVQSTLDTLASEGRYRMSTAISSSEINIAGLTTYARLNLPAPLDYYTQYTPFVYSSGNLPEFASAVNMANVVPNSEKDAFVAAMRAQGRDFVNYTLTARNASNNAVIPAPYADVYFPQAYVLPMNDVNRVGLGFDQGSEAGRNETLRRCIRTKSRAASGKSVASSQGVRKVISSIYTPVFDSNNTLRHVSVFAIRIGDMIQTAMSDVVKSVIVTVSDLNATTPDSRFLYNTKQYAGVETQYLDMTAAQNDDMIRTAEFKSEVQVNFGDRVWQITFLSTSGFVQLYTPVDRIISIIVPIIVFIILIAGCFAIFFTQRLHIAKAARNVTEIQNTYLKHFIPRNLFRIAGCGPVGDFKPGRSGRSRMVVMYITLSNFNSLCNIDVDTGSLLAGAFRDPVDYIRKRNGTVYATAGPSIMAIVSNGELAMEIANQIKDSQENRYELQIVIHRTDVHVIGIYEGERIITSLFHDKTCERVSANIQDHGNSILVTSDTVQKRPPNSDLVGRVDNKDIYAVYKRRRTKEDYIHNITSNIIGNKYTEAYTLLLHAKEKDTNDLDTERIYERVRKKIEIASMVLNNWRIDHTFSYPLMTETFYKFCSREKSVENINLWFALQNFINTSSDFDLRDVARNIYDRFLRDNVVNTDQRTIDGINQLILDETRPIKRDLFKDLQTELLILMTDTHSRFKQDPSFTDAVCAIL